MELTKNQQSELNDIAFSWDSHNLGFDGDVYTASRIGYPEHILTAETTSNLRELIRRDYMAWTATLQERSSL